MSETAVPVLRLTDQGAALIARAVAQEKLTITRLAMGDGQLANVGSIPGLTAQIHERVSVPITKTTRKDNKLTVSGEVTLASTVSPFRWREVSLHGRIGTEAEVLMGYLYNSENGEMVSPADGVERCIYVTLEIDPVANVEVVLVPRESIDWEQIANPPEAYPPANHTHTAGDVGAAPVNHTHSAGDVGAAPASHTHSASDVGASPTGHKHSTDDLNGGILPVKRGGTGKGTALTADDVGALPASGGTLTGDLRLKDSRNYGMALRFGDGDIVKISEPSDDVLELRRKCDGTFHAHGQAVKCRLSDLCQAPGARDHQLEYLHPTRPKSTILTWKRDPDRVKAHNDRYVGIIHAFGVTAERRKATLERHPETRERRNRKQREKRRAEALLNPPKPRVVIPPPPCGGDHRNCPYGGECKYPTWEDDWIRDKGKRIWERVLADPELHEHRKATHRARYHRLKEDPERWAEEQAKRAAAQQRLKEAIKADPARNAAEKEKQAARNKKAREAIKADPVKSAYWRERNKLYSRKRRAKAKFIKSGGTPEEFEKYWTERMMDHVEGETEGRRQDVVAAVAGGG